MEVGHDSMNPTLVDGYPDAGSYVRPVTYVTFREQFEEQVQRSYECEQYIKYRCFQSKLLSDAGKYCNH